MMQSLDFSAYVTLNWDLLTLFRDGGCYRGLPGYCVRLMLGLLKFYEGKSHQVTINPLVYLRI